MALTSTIRKHSGLFAGIVAIGLILLLIGGDIIQLGSILSGRHTRDVGEIAGQKIALQTYQTQVEQLRRQNPPNTSLQEALIRDQAWQQLTTQLNYQRECDALGLVISEDELVDMVQGEHIHPELQIAFRDPQTNQFDKKQLIGYLQKVAQMPEAQRALWRQLERGMAALRQREKYTQMMVQSAWTTNLETQAQHEATQNTLHIKYLYIPYYTHRDDSAQITNEMLKDYLVAHKDAYQVAESINVQYIVFPITPTKEDEQTFQDELQALKESFAQTKDDRFFTKINTDGVPTSSYFSCASQQLPGILTTQEQKLEKGMVIGPVREDNVYKLYKIAAINQPSAEPYEVAVIEKQLAPSEQTRDRAFRRADLCVSTVKSAMQLETYATREGLQLQEAQVGKNDVQVGNLIQARELARWLYNDAAVGQISPVFELDNEYVVAAMTQHVPSGTAPLAQVRDQLTLKMSNQKKADAILAKLQQFGNMALEELATQYGPEAQLLEVEHLRFEDDTLPNAGMTRKAIGAAFALAPNTWVTVADDNGVLIVKVIAKNGVDAPQDSKIHQQSLWQLEKIKQPYEILRALETLNPTKDNRYKFY